MKYAIKFRTNGINWWYTKVPPFWGISFSKRIDDAHVFNTYESAASQLEKMKSFNANIVLMPC